MTILHLLLKQSIGCQGEIGWQNIWIRSPQTIYSVPWHSSEIGPVKYQGKAKFDYHRRRILFIQIGLASVDVFGISCTFIYTTNKCYYFWILKVLILTCMVNTSDPDFGADNVQPKKTHDVGNTFKQWGKKISILFGYWASSFMS